MHTKVAFASILLLFSIAAASAQPDRRFEANSQAGPANQLPVVVVIDFNVLFAQSAFGIRAFEERRDALLALKNENDGISRMLEAEEDELAARKAKMSDVEFAPLADDFDRRANLLRSRQDEKGAKVDEWYQRQQQVFVFLTGQLIGNLVETSNISVVLPAESTVWYRDSIDATRGVLARANELLGDGTEIEGYQSALAYAEIEGRVPRENSETEQTAISDSLKNSE